MTDDERIEIERFEDQQWHDRGWERQREAYIAKLKGTVSGLIERRLAAFRWAEAVVEVVERAYAAHDMIPGEGETLSGPKLAKWLNDNGVRVPLRPGSPKPETVGKARANALLHETDAMMIDLAVQECRTLMTARALSADFEGEALGELERRYVEIVAEFMCLGRRLRNERPLFGSELFDRARQEAANVAKAQREKKPVTMSARERFWRDRDPPMKKVFETK